MKKHRETNRVIKFLKGLNEQFTIVRSQIIYIDRATSIHQQGFLVSNATRKNMVDERGVKSKALIRFLYFKQTFPNTFGILLFFMLFISSTKSQLQF